MACRHHLKVVHSRPCKWRVHHGKWPAGFRKRPAYLGTNPRCNTSPLHPTSHEGFLPIIYGKEVVFVQHFTNEDVPTPMGVPTVASGRRRSQALEMPFFGPLLRAPRSCTTACDPSTHIFSRALCHERSFHHIFILTEKTVLYPKVTMA